MCCLAVHALIQNAVALLWLLLVFVCAAWELQQSSASQRLLKRPSAMQLLLVCLSLQHVATPDQGLTLSWTHGALCLHDH
jgi:uncharacterized membrane protein YwzB